MINFKEIIKTIDISKMKRNGVDFYNMCETEFQIYEFITQPDHKERLTYCYYHKWICTDTEVGIRVWYFDNKPVCISWQPYRKSSETFGWISKDDFDNVRKYILSLKNEDEDSDVYIIDDETINNVIEKFDSIEYKTFEERNVRV